MPHFIVECSHILINQKTAEELIQAVYSKAENSGLFAESGPGAIKVRINPFQHFTTGGTKENFIHVFANIMEGRTEEQKKNLSFSIVEKLKEMYPEVPIISMNVNDIDKATYCNKSML